MELREFVKDYNSIFKWSGVEEKSGMTISSLRHYISGKRELSEDNFRKLKDFFEDYGIDLEYNRSKVSRNPQRNL